jgi:hypothetical protein
MPENVYTKNWSNRETKTTVLYFDNLLLKESQLILDNEKFIRGEWDGDYVEEFISEHVIAEIMENVVNGVADFEAIDSGGYLMSLLEIIDIDWQQIADHYK